MKLYIKSNSNSGYLYIFKHGVGPGTIPKDAAFLKEKDLPNGYTAVWLDRFLTDRELKAYDIPSETEINYYLDRIGYCQKNGDVVPCDDIEACGDIKASRTIDRWDHNTKKYEPVEIPDDWNVATFSSDLDEEVNCVHCGKPLPYGDSYCSRRYHDKYGMGYAECEDCYEEQLKDEFGSKDVEACDKVTASDICYRDRDNDDRVVALDVGMSDEDVEKMLAEHPSYYRSTLDRFEACDNVMAYDHRYSAGRIEDDGTEDFYYDTGFDSWDEACDWGINHKCTHIYDREKNEYVPIESCDTKYFANMVSCSSDPELDDEFLVEGYYDNQRRGLAESAETSDVSALNELVNEYANKGYYIVVHNITDGCSMEFTPDHWFDSLAPDGGAELFMTW